MKTILFDKNSSLEQAAEIIKNGGLVAFPTETVYGLGANALDASAAEKTYKAKGRPSDNPLIIHLASADDVEKYAYVNETFNEIAKLFMPGPITVVLPKKEIIPKTVTGGLDTVAVRIPSNETARKLISLAGVPISAPSANISGRPSCTSFDHVVEDMYGRIDGIIDGGDSAIGLESTIVIPCDGMHLKLLRPGGITVEMLCDAGFTVEIDKVVTQKLSDNERPLAPGMKYRHYSPRAKVVLLEGNEEKIKEFLYSKANENDTAVILYNEELDHAGKNTVYIGSKDDEKTQAKLLFSLLRSFDANKDIKTVYARVPSTKKLGLAIYNRLVKAAGYTVIEL